MANNPIRFRKGYEPSVTGIRRMKRRDVAGTIRALNKGLAAAGTELGSPNGGPAPTYSGGGGGGLSDGGGGIILS